MVTSALSPERDEVERRPATLGLKVGHKLQNIVPQVERDSDPDREAAATWFYWCPCPGVRFYTYEKASEPVQRIESDKHLDH